MDVAGARKFHVSSRSLTMIIPLVVLLMGSADSGISASTGSSNRTHGRPAEGGRACQGGSRAGGGADEKECRVGRIGCACSAIVSRDQQSQPD